MTYIVQLKETVADDGFPVIPMPNPLETAVYQSRSLLRWWRPTLGVPLTTSWTDRRSGNAATLIRQAPAVVMTDATLNVPYANWPTETQTGVYATPEDVLTGATGVTFAWVGKLAPGARSVAQAVLGNATHLNSSYAGYSMSSESILFRNNASSSFIVTPLPNPEAIHLIIASLDFASNTGAVYIDGTQVATGTSSPDFSSNRISIGGVTGNGSDVTATAFKGDLYDIWVYGSALHLAENADQLAALNALAVARYHV